MALWAQSQALTGEALHQLQMLYADNFPMEVRHFMASWIEEKVLELTDIFQHSQYAELFSDFIQQLEAIASTFQTEDMFIHKYKLLEAAISFKIRFGSNPFNLFKLMKHCLDTEVMLINQSQETVQPTVSHSSDMDRAFHMGHVIDPNLEILQRLELCRSQTQETGDDLRALELQIQSLTNLEYNNLQKLDARLATFTNEAQASCTAKLEMSLLEEKASLERKLNAKESMLMQQLSAIGEKLSESVSRLSTLQSTIVCGELIGWNLQQKRAGNGALAQSSLLFIQDWCEILAEIIWDSRKNINEAIRLKSTLQPSHCDQLDTLQILLGDITQLISALLTKTFIVDKQPPQVLRLDTKFTSTVRLVVGCKLSVHMSPPHVRVFIINEAQTLALIKSHRIDADCEDSGEILNNSGYMQYEYSERHFSISFRNLQLKNIKYLNKKTTTAVTDEKFCLLFASQTTVGNREMAYEVYTLSMPVVVARRRSEETHAWATTTWENAFSLRGQMPFVVPDTVFWHQVAETLNMKFASATGRQLSDGNLYMLAGKMFSESADGPHITDYSKRTVSWFQFNSVPILGRSFTFWEWFYALMTLTKDHLKGPWTDGCILGFISKKLAVDMLYTCPTGTFLLRFSESLLGGVSIAWMEEQVVYMLQPLTARDLAIRPLADILQDLCHLRTLFPNIPKAAAFGKYYTPFKEKQPTTKDGYITTRLITCIPGLGMTCSCSTPQSVHQSQTTDAGTSTQDQYSESQV